MKKKLILANKRSKLVSSQYLRKGWSTTFLHHVYPEDNSSLTQLSESTD